MSKRAKLIQKITNAAATNNVTFDELCECAKQVGWNVKPRKGTSHIIYWHPKCPDLLDFQPAKNGQSQALSGQATSKFYKLVKAL